MSLFCSRSDNCRSYYSDIGTTENSFVGVNSSVLPQIMVARGVQVSSNFILIYQCTRQLGKILISRDVIHRASPKNLPDILGGSRSRIQRRLMGDLVPY